jgi:mannose-6-phosphate isomerase
MADLSLYPLPFAPLFKSMLWGGRRLAEFLPGAPGDGPLGEAWVLSDVRDHHSPVADGPHRGRTLRDLLAHPDGLGAILGDRRTDDGRFPLLLKFIDARDHLSVQVHPDDERARLVGPLLRGKTEAWVILHAEPGARLYAGLRPGVDAAALRRALADGTAADCLHSYEVKPGDCVFLRAGTVHAIGAGLFLFEVQQTSDITYRLFDWNRVDAKTGKSRDLHVEQALHCTDFAAGPCHPVRPELEASEPARRERLVACPYFDLWRHHGDMPFPVGADGTCRAVVCVSGRAELRHGGHGYALRPGSVYLLPAAVGACEVWPHGPVTVLECGV